MDLSNVRVALQSDPLNIIRDAILNDATLFAGANIDAAISSRASASALATHDTDIKALIAALNDLSLAEIEASTKLTLRATSPFVVREKFFADTTRITLNTGSSSEAIKTNFSITLIPSGVTLDYVHVLPFAQVVENTNAAANKTDGAQNIQIQKNSGGSWTNCVAVLDDALRVPAATRDMGRLIGAPVDCKGEVDSNTAYDLQWTNSLVDQDSIYLDEVFFIVEIGFH